MDETLIEIARVLILIFFMILPTLGLIFLMSLELPDKLSKFLKIFLCILLPLIVILIGVVVGVNNFNVDILNLAAFWYYAISITWFGLGIVYFTALDITK